MIALALAATLNCGQLQPPPLPSFWCVLPGAIVRHQGGQVWRATAEGAAYDVVTAQGDYDWVEIDRRLVAGRFTLHFPLMGAGP